MVTYRRGEFHLQTSDALPVGERLWIQELNIQKEIKRHWQEISSYVTSVLRTTGISGVGLPPKVKSDYSKKATNWWLKSVPFAAMLACRGRWPGCCRSERGWKTFPQRRGHARGVRPVCIPVSGGYDDPALRKRVLPEFAVKNQLIVAVPLQMKAQRRLVAVLGGSPRR